MAAKALYWLNSVDGVPGALLVNGLDDLTDGLVICDLIRHVGFAVPRHASSSDDLSAALQVLGKCRGWGNLSRLLSAPDAAARIALGDEPTIVALLGDLRGIFQSADTEDSAPGGGWDTGPDGAAEGEARARGGGVDWAGSAAAPAGGALLGDAGPSPRASDGPSKAGRGAGLRGSGRGGGGRGGGAGRGRGGARKGGRGGGARGGARGGSTKKKNKKNAQARAGGKTAAGRGDDDEAAATGWGDGGGTATLRGGGGFSDQLDNLRGMGDFRNMDGNDLEKNLEMIQVRQKDECGRVVGGVRPCICVCVYVFVVCGSCVFVFMCAHARDNVAGALWCVGKRHDGGCS